ncbi:MAG: hypothetical protein ACSHX8_04125 [Opitutaceae bacterium]
MAFVLLLLVSITTLVQVESESANISKRKMEARLNAQLGLQVAIGELQAAMGPDARVSANASILDSDPSTAEIDGVEHTHWLGVYPTVDPNNVDNSLLNPKALRDWSLAEVKWLVSEKRGSTLDPAAALNNDDAVTLAQFIDDAATSLPDLSLIESLPATSLSKAQAELVEVYGKNQAIPSGRYAWWVGDESMKARVNTRASEMGDDVLSGTEIDAEAQKRSNYLVTQGTNFTTWLPGYNDNLNDLDKVLAPTGLDSLAISSGNTDWAKWSALNWDKFTPYSQSLPVDVVNGRLKKDLTAFLAGSYTGLDQQPMIDARFDISSGAAPGSRKFKEPTFDLLKQWATMVNDNTAAQAVVAPNYAEESINPQYEHGLHPVITQGAVAMKHSYKIIGPRTFQPVYIFMPQIQLMNPHNVPLEAQDYIVQIGYQFKWWMRVDGYQGTNIASFVGIEPEFHSWEAYSGQEPLPEHIPATNENIQYQGNKRFFTFVIKDQAFEPGESLIFYSKPPESGAIAGVEYNLNSDADTNILNNYTDDEDLNLLFNEASLDESFFYVVSPSVGTFEDPGNNPNHRNAQLDIYDSFYSQTNFKSDITNSDANSEEDLAMHINLYAFQNDQPLLLHAITKGQKNHRWGNWKRPTYPLRGYQAGNRYDTDTVGSFADKNPLINLGTSMLSSNFDVFAGGNNMNLPPKAGQPHAVLAYWNIRNQESFSTSADWAQTPGTIEASSWLNTFSFRSIANFFNTWETTDNLYGNLSTDRLGGWHQSQVQGSVYPFFDYPTSPYGPISLGSFQHANLSVYGWQPTYAFGNAQAPPRFNRNLTQDATNDDLYDISYLMNASTWDQYYLSTIPQSGASLVSGMRLPNSRQYLKKVDGESILDSTRLTDDDGFDLSASSVLINGGFNVNSTSLTAWKAFLSGAMGQSVATTFSAADSNVDTAAAMGRFFAPLLEEPAGVAIDRSAINFNDANSWAATRTLNAGEIDTLAERIVEEVKRRGPFLSLADFVNRRLEPDASVTNDERVYQEVLGTLQAAINKATLVDQEINYHYYNAHVDGDHVMAINPADDWSTRNFTVSSEAQEAMFGAPASTIDSAGGLIHSYAPNFLSQADVLTKIGPSITVRGDTFVIRSYGDSRHPFTDKVVSAAWCEAVVQRVTTPIGWDGSKEQLIQTQALDDVATVDLGRRFKLISFRWLSPEEVTPYSNDDAI